MALMYKIIFENSGTGADNCNNFKDFRSNTELDFIKMANKSMKFNLYLKDLLAFIFDSKNNMGQIFYFYPREMDCELMTRLM